MSYFDTSLSCYRDVKMEVQAEIHSLPSERKSLLQSTSHLTIPYDRIVNSMRQARENRDLLKLAEQIEVLDDQGALTPLHKVRKSLHGT